MTNRFRYSPELWPNAALPVPRVARGRFSRDSGGWLIRDLRDWEALELASPPEEMHLREMRDADKRDPESLRAMCEMTGVVLPYDKPWSGVTNRRAMPRIAEGHYRLAVENVAKQLGLPTPIWSARPADGAHVAEVAYRLVLVELMVNHLECALTDRPTAPVWQARGFFDDLDDALNVPLPGVAALEDESPETLAWWYFAGLLNDGLGGVSPRIVPPAVESQPYIDDISDAYTAACVLVFNDLQQGTPYRRCADETCGRIFSHQLGRSRGAFSRSEGVVYCSPTHARNQSQRERRRRDRANRRST